MEKEVRKFGLRDKLGYMFGDFGNDFTFILSSAFLLKFYTDVMGVSAGLIGIMMMLARFVDAFTDVAMGQIVDRSKPRKKGKFLPWILRISGPVTVASFLMYATWFQNMPMGFKIFWMFFTYLLWGSVFYTGVNIPYGSMASAITADPKERAELSNWRSIGAALAGTIISVVLPIVVYYKDAAGNDILSGSKMAIAALVCSIGSLLCYFLCYVLITERVSVEQKTGKFQLKGLVIGLVKNKSLVGIVISSICLLLAQLMLTGMSSYVFPNYFRSTQAQSAAGLVGLVATLLCATFTVKISAKYGRKELATASSLFSAAVLILAFFMQIENPWLFVGIYTLIYVGIAVFTLICWAMITDVIDDTEVRTGERSDGTIYAVYSFARKIGQAVSSGLTGVLLGIIGYSQGTAYDGDVVKGIYNITCLAPAIGFILLALSLIFLYPLNRKRVEENAKLLAKKNGEKIRQ